VPLNGHFDKAVGFHVANFSVVSAWTVRVCDEVGWQAAPYAADPDSGRRNAIKAGRSLPDAKTPDYLRLYTFPSVMAASFTRLCRRSIRSIRREPSRSFWSEGRGG